MKKYLIIFIILSIFFSINLYGQKQPVWISDAKKVYDASKYEFAVGSGNSEKEAENNAFTSLSRVFGMTVKTDTKAQQRFIQNSKGLEKNSTLEDNTLVEAEHDLINVRIAESYYDAKKKKYYALAVMNKKETVPLIVSKVKENTKTIKNYINKSDNEKDLLRKFSLLDMAYIVSLKNDSFLQQLMILDSSVNVSIEENLKSSIIKDKLDNVAKNITFAVDTGEFSSSVKLVIEQMISDLKLKMSASAPTYTFKEHISYDGNDTGYGMYVLNYMLLLELVDYNGVRVTSFSFKGKEVGANEESAKKVVGSKLAKSIKEPLSEQFGEFLNNMLK